MIVTPLNLLFFFAYFIQRMVKILIANRGEIAIRVIIAATELGHQTVAIYSNDQDKSHCLRATEAVKVSSFLDVQEIIQTAKR